MKRIINNIIALVIAFIIYYFTLPAFNLQSMGFYTYLFVVVTMFVIANLGISEVEKLKFTKKVKVNIGTKNKSFGVMPYSRRWRPQRDRCPRIRD